jgi:antitoxin CptB
MQTRRKRLMFRCHHMGCTENDALFGGFAERYLADLSDEQVGRMEVLLDENDADLFAWVLGRLAPPAEHDNDVMRMLKEFAKSEAAIR